MISVLDIFSVGIGPSSSHTVGPMRAAQQFVSTLASNNQLLDCHTITTDLYGSLGQTGKGHGTGKAVILGLLGKLPESIEVDEIEPALRSVREQQVLLANGQQPIHFADSGAIIFHRRKTLSAHANGMTITAKNKQQTIIHQQTYFSVGGGFIVTEDQLDEFLSAEDNKPKAQYNFETAEELLNACRHSGLSISGLMFENEKSFHSVTSLTEHLWSLWQVMESAIARGIDSEGLLPGGLKLKRRAPALHRRLRSEQSNDPMQVMDWVNLFALAVSEENAAGHRIVTAPTNGAAGVIPAVMAYYNRFIEPLDKSTASRFLLTAAAIGILYKKNASISGAEVGCQGEVGVACSMAAAGLAEIMGATIEEVENAAEIGMEHNLGLTCDPVGGLVQVPCIERNAMGAIKAINACRLALRGEGQHKVSLDKVIKTMWETGNDMKTKYKETARGGLAVNIIGC